MTLLEKIQQQITNRLYDEKPSLFVLKGFDFLMLMEVKEYKLMDVGIEISIQQLDASKAMLLPQLFNKTDQWYWCTYEEYLLIGEELLQLYYSVETIYNNLYHHTFLTTYKIEVNNGIWELLLDEEAEDELVENDQLSLIYRYYGNVKQINNEYYVTYTSSGENEIPYYENLLPLPINSVSDSDSIFLELSDNEDEFLDLIYRLLNRRIMEVEIKIAVSGDLDLMPYRYKTRLQVLNTIIGTDYSICLVIKETIAREIDESPYVSILNRYWGHSNFRSLKMYKNVQNSIFDKMTIEISQVQIVDDLVHQALKAKAGEDYRDLFVTSPTGAGKSIMFQVPAVHLAEKYNLMTIIISPLIGLMNDQVQSLLSNQVHMSATINSEISPVEKIEIQNKIQSGQVSILYISPETLLSGANITQLIGERKVGLFVVDEAHIVTTWGKAFRSDYWYLGTYLSKLRKEMDFPIATFTATAIYGGIEDMYVETRDSLNLISPISYFGYVKRDDIEILIKRSEKYDKKYSEYLMDKNKLLLNRIEKFVKYRVKTLIYFPTVGFILDFKEYVRMHGSEEAISMLSIYYGPLEKELKNENYLRFKSNDSLVMLATKAFGMGIDIPDIQNVYHFAPTGNVCDYIQEIGRAARALDKGYAFFDFLPQDFVHIQRLHGISIIKKNQLLQVIEKILSILDSHKGKKVRNLLISADEFRYIFNEGNIRENDNFDNKIKTALLIIEKDFQAKLTYSPIVARPRSLFANEYFMVPYDTEKYISPIFRSYFLLKETFGEGTSQKSIYEVDLKGIWQDHYTSMSFPEFKYQFHSGNKVKLPFKGKVTSVMQIKLELKTDNIKTFAVSVKQWTDRINIIMSRYAKTKTYFNVEDIALELRKIVGGSKYTSQTMATIILDSCYTFDRLMRKDNNFYNRFLAYDDSRGKYHLISSGYSGFTDWIVRETSQMHQQQMSLKISDQKQEIYFPKLFGTDSEKRFIYLGLMEALGLIMYRVNGGDNPEIFIRINSRRQLERTIANPARYRNYILENVHKRHRVSVEMLRYIFESQVDTKNFWNLIENYFLGEIPEEILERLS